MARFSASYLEKLGRDWQAAYQAAWKETPPDVVWSNGWFKIDGCRYRRAEVERLTENLRSLSNSSPVRESDK